MSEDELREVLAKYIDISMGSPEIDRMLASEHVFSKRFEKKMKRLLWSQRHFGKDIHVGYVVRKIAIAAGIILSLLVANEVSARVWGFGAWEIIRGLVDGGRGMRMEFHKSGENGEKDDLPKVKYDLPQYVPEGYQQEFFEDFEDQGVFLDVEWRGEKENQYIRYSREQLIDGTTIVQDAEIDMEKKILVKGIEAKLIYDGEMIDLLWCDDNYSYALCSYIIDEEELIHMMKSMYN